MDIITKKILAQEILIIIDSYSYEYSVFQKNEQKKIEEQILNPIDVIDKILNDGVEINTLVEEKRGDINSVKPLICAVFNNCYQDDVLNLFLNKLTEENLSKLSLKEINYLYENFEKKDKLLDKLFNIGFDFKQGTFEEVDKALDFDFVFFEYCLKYKKDFDFSYQYEPNKSLDKIVKEELEYTKETNQNKESFLSFLTKAKESQELYQKLTMEMKQEYASINKGNKI